MQNFQNFGPMPSPSPVRQETHDAKKSLQKDVMKACLLLVAVIVGANVVSAVAGVVVGIVMTIPSALQGYDPQAVMNSLSGSLTYQFLAGYLPMMLVELAAVLVAVKLFKLPFKRILGQNQLDGRFTALGIFGCIGIGVIGQFISILLLFILELIHFPLYLPELTVDWSQPVGSVLLLLYICLIGPVLEELIFRGVILKLLQKHGVSFAVIFSAILFAIFHQNVAQIFLPLVLGIMLALITIRSGSIVPAILAHIVNNTLSMVLDMVLPLDNAVLYWVGYIIYAVIMLGVGAIFMILYGHELTPILRWRSPEMKLSKQLGTAMIHWPTLILLGLYALTFIYSIVLAVVEMYL